MEHVRSPFLYLDSLLSHCRKWLAVRRHAALTELLLDYSCPLVSHQSNVSNDDFTRESSKRVDKGHRISSRSHRTTTTVHDSHRVSCCLSKYDHRYLFEQLCHQHDVPKQSRVSTDQSNDASGFILTLLNDVSLTDHHHVADLSRFQSNGNVDSMATVQSD
jgi:hypothetical protein